jgi:hypothetical protein
VARVIAVASFAVACTSDGAEYLERLETWRNEGPADYTWTLEASEPVLGPRQAEIRVRNGHAVAIDGDVLNGAPVTVEELIVYLTRVADRARSLTVEWDELGYPRRIGIDHSDAIDDEVRYRVLAFRVD